MTTAQKVIKYLAIAFAIFLIVNIISAILCGIFGFAFIFGIKTDNEKIRGEMISTNFEYEDIKTLDIDIAFSSLEIKSGEELKIETHSNSINCRKNNQTIQVEEKNYNWLSKNNSRDLIIYIPDDLEFDKIKINTGAGRISIEKIKTKKLYLEIGAGETRIEELEVTDKADIDGGAGKVTILSGIINDLHLDMGVGKVEINAKLIGNTDIDAGIGELAINVEAPEEDYKVKASKGIGNINIDGKNISSDAIYGDGNNYIKIDGGIGNIKVEFKQ